MQTVIMVVEDVLRMTESEGHHNDGLTLYRALVGESRLYLISAVWGEEELGHWLRLRGLRGHIGFQRVYDPSYVDFAVGIRRLHLQGSRSPAFIIDADLGRAAALISLGFTVMCVARPNYSNPRWQPDYKHQPTPWEHVRAEIERQDELRYADERLKEACE